MCVWVCVCVCVCVWRGRIILPPVGFWYFAAFVAFSNISLERNFRAKLGFPNSPQSSDIGQNYFWFPDFWSSLIKENCHNSRTSDEIDMKLGPVTKEKQNDIKKT